jgi:NadR type nicotinamide-nucleotide adenylyltransferase
MTLGLIIGKFYPLTKGHEYFINTAIQKVDKLVVIMAGKESEIPHPKYRLKWMKQIFDNPNILIIRINDIYDPIDSELWAILSKKWLGIIEYNSSFINNLENLNILTEYPLEINDVIPDYVFTSELYGDIWARYINFNSNKKCEHILVDLERINVPISATQVRKDPFKNKNYLNKIIFKFYTKRFVFVGPESVYKTRITKDLSKILNLPLISEYGDEYCNLINIKLINWTNDIFIHIAENQNNNENKEAELHSHIICDTNMLSTIIFGERYMGYEPVLPKNLLDHLDEFKYNTTYFLMDYKDVDFIQNENNTRELEINNCPITTEKSVREWMYNKFLKKLNDNNYNYHILSGTYDEKLKNALNIINNNNDIIINISNNKYKYNDLFKSLYLDLYIFSYCELFLLSLFIIINFIFTFIDFNQIVYSNKKSIFQWENDTANNIELWKRIIYLLNGIISFSGVLSVVMATKKKISTYLWGFMNSLFLGLYAFAYGYIGNFQLNIIFFLPLQIVGIYKWFYNMENNLVLINNLYFYDYIKIIFAIIILIVGFYYEIPFITKLITNQEYIFINNIYCYLLDVISTSLSIVAQILMINRNKEQWILWIIVNILQIALYSINDIIINIVIMWCVFLCNACNGLFIWYKK